MSVQTVRDAWDFYKNSILSSCNSKKSTLISDESRWKCHINPILGNKRIDMLTKTPYCCIGIVNPGPLYYHFIATSIEGRYKAARRLSFGP